MVCHITYASSAQEIAIDRSLPCQYISPTYQTFSLDTGVRTSSLGEISHTAESQDRKVKKSGVGLFKIEILKTTNDH
jgi:hypothetical protein